METSIEKLTEVIKLVENLRSSIYVVFDELVGGKTINDGIKDHHSINDKEKGKKLVSNLHINLLNGVNRAISLLEMSMSSLGRFPLSVTASHPAFHLISLESKSSNINSQIYETLHNNYINTARLCDNSETMFKRLTRNLKFRSSADIESISGQPFSPQLVTLSKQHWENLVIKMNMKFSKEGSLKLNLMNSPTCIMIRAIVSPVLKACIVMQGQLIHRIIVHSYNEETSNDTIWPPSKFIVFQKVTDIANSAALHFQSNTPKFLIWLSWYQRLYSQPCRSCQKILSDENDKDRFLPPVRRDFVHNDWVYHLSCYSCTDDVTV